VNSINGAYALAHPSPKLIANAIHAITAGVEGSTTQGADLDTVLKRDRAALKVLVAEDNPTNQRIIRQFLESAGYEVVLASDGEEALDLYESESPDLAILDFNMPQRSGIEVIQAIRAMEPPGERLPAVILSASVTLEARERAANAGADEFVGKPFDAASLIEQIDRLGSRTVASRKRPKVSANRLSARPTLSVVDSRPRKSEEANNSALANPLVDRGRLAQLEDIARDSAFLAELIGGFFNDVDSILEKTRSAIATGNIGALPDLMHSLRGAAVSVGANKLATLAFDLDRAVEKMGVQDLATIFSDIENCFEQTSAYLKQYLQTQHHA
jgi:two-component system sensor histidine kinase RpfC